MTVQCRALPNPAFAWDALMVHPFVLRCADKGM